MLSRVLVGDWPLEQGYGPATYDAEPEGHGYHHWHEGVDLGCPVGTTCLSTVPFVCSRIGPGYVVLVCAEIEHYYFHVSAPLVFPGLTGPAGYPVARSGQEAVGGGVKPTGPHLHYGVRRAPYRYQMDDFDPTPYYGPTFGPDPGGDTDLQPDERAALFNIQAALAAVETALNELPAILAAVQAIQPGGAAGPRKITGTFEGTEQ